VFERDRTDIDEPIEFDFFDESPTVEAVREESKPRARRRMPTRPPGGGPNAPLLRLGLLIAGGIVLAVGLILWVNACQGARTGPYQSYMTDVEAVAGDSAQIGRDLNALIFSSGIQLEDLQNQLEGLREAQGQVVRRAEDLDAPGPLREQQESLVEAMLLRQSGLSGLAAGFSGISDAEAAGPVGTDLARQSMRLVASDILYEDFFRARAQEVMDGQGVTGVAVPESTFVSNLELASAESWGLVVERLLRPPAEGGLRGNSIAGVRALPEGTQLSPSEDNTVIASQDLALEVSVENSGESQETQVVVTLTVQQSPEPLREEQTIQSINPGDTKTVTFREFGLPQFGARTIVKVTVEPVQGETNTNNNTAEYVVFFTIPD
jgi:hypothetical protein